MTTLDLSPSVALTGVACDLMSCEIIRRYGDSCRPVVDATGPWHAARTGSVGMLARPTVMPWPWLL